uniref:hypothetical protein n=1 Tax=Acetatifactor sp. TaxID=1872090 RepID=UPI00405720CE
MKKTIIKIVVFALTFIVSLFVGGRIMNKDHNNMTMEMAVASFPVVSMKDGGTNYNRLFGYSNPSDTAFQRDTITVLGENRDTGFTVDTYGRDVTAISIEVRSIDGSRLIEDTPVTEMRLSGDEIYADIALKDLIEKDKEYSLAIVLELDEAKEVRYYTRVIWSDNLHLTEKMAYVVDFHQRLYDKEAAKELTKYLETNSLLEDNKSLHKVNIHSSFKQITWGDLEVKEIREPVVQLTEIADQTASFLLDYIVSGSEGKVTTYYRVEEHYRVRYTTERMYLLDYERTMTQIPDVEHMYANDKILLGIVDANVSMVESEDGNIVVFEEENQLLSYNVTTNKLAVIFSFYDSMNNDVRAMNKQHAIKILDVDEGGNVKFAVYGYMNRGRHEGEVGIQIYAYDSALNTIEELVYLPYDKSYAVLAMEMEQLLYLNRSQDLYIFLEDTVYGINLLEKTYEELVKITQDDSLQVSDNHKIIVWQEGNDIYNCGQLKVRNLAGAVEREISVQADEAIRPLGFMGEDIVYGVAKKTDVVNLSSGRVFFPMYKVCICDSNGKLLKEYRQNDIYVTDCTMIDNQITLSRVKLLENGRFETITADHIMDNTEENEGKNKIVIADIEIYQRYIQIQTKKSIDSKSIKILTPKEVVFEGGRTLLLDTDSNTERYYVYGAYGVDGIFSAPAKAVNLAYEIAGVVVNNSGDCVWLKGNRVSRNQIMAIKEPENVGGRSSLAVCLDTMLAYEGISANAEYLLTQGQNAIEILQNNLEDAQILDLTGCNLDSVLYYVNRDIPVLAMLDNGEAVLVTGFNEFNTVIMDPKTGWLGKKGMNDSAEWFEEEGNHFVTYIRLE